MVDCNNFKENYLYCEYELDSSTDNIFIALEINTYWTLNVMIVQALEQTLPSWSEIIEVNFVKYI